MRTICVLRYLAVSDFFTTFARDMKLKLIILLCITTWVSSSLPAEGQGMYVFSREGCDAYDIRNIEEVRVVDSYCLKIGSSFLYPCAEIDSITFAEPLAETRRMGWWGDMGFGRSACYYQSFLKDYPNMVVEAADSLCTSALYYLPDEVSDSREGLQKVGRKWRYVKNTLSGRRKIELHLFDKPDDWLDIAYDTHGRACLNYSSAFDYLPASTLRQAVNYWFHPDTTASLPASPVFGSFDGLHYEVSLPVMKEPVRFTINLGGAAGYIDTDTTTIVFPDTLTATESFHQMDISDDECTLFSLDGNRIIIVELFHATVDEVMKWLVRFDLDICKPIFIREEE